MNEFLLRLTSRKFILAVVTFLLFVFADKLQIDAETKRYILTTFLGYIGVEGINDVTSKLQSK